MNIHEELVEKVAIELAFCGSVSYAGEAEAVIKIVKEAAIKGVLDSNYPPEGEAIKAIKLL